MVYASSSCRERKKKKAEVKKASIGFPRRKCKCEAPGRVIALDLIRINMGGEMHQRIWLFGKKMDWPDQPAKAAKS